MPTSDYTCGLKEQKRDGKELISRVISEQLGFVIHWHIHVASEVLGMAPSEVMFVQHRQSVQGQLRLNAPPQTGFCCRAEQKGTATDTPPRARAHTKETSGKERRYGMSLLSGNGARPSHA